MRIVEVKKIEDCFDGSRVYRYWFDRAWTEEAIVRLRSLGELDYFPEFPRPFFRLVGQGGMQVKGVAGEDNCRAIFPKAEQDRIRQEFEDLFAHVV